MRVVRSRRLTIAAVALPVLAGYVFHVLAHLAGAAAPFQDDMRQHVLGLQPTADLYGRYFAATVPWGARALSAVVSPMFSPLDWARWGQPLLIAALLGWVSWRLGVRLFERRGERAAGSALLLVWVVQAMVWSGDDLVSSTPRAWALLLVLWALDGAVRRSVWRVALALVGGALFYAPVCGVIGALLVWANVPRDGRRLLLGGAALLVAGALVVLGKPPRDEVGPTVTRAEARGLPEFGTHGRAEYFNDRAYDYWVTGARSGFVTRDTQMPWLVLLCGGATTLLLRGRRVRESSERWDWQTLAVLGASGLLLYLLAHAFWFHLFHPNRHLQYCVTALAAVTLSAAFPRVRWWGIAMLAITLFLASLFQSGASYQRGTAVAGVGATLRRTLPPGSNAVVAAFPGSDIGAALPLIHHVPVVASLELSLPYHRAFYGKASSAISDTLDAWATDQPDKLMKYLGDRGVTHVLLEPESWPLKVAASGGRRKYRWPKRQLNEPWDDRFVNQLSDGRGSLLREVVGRLRVEGPVLLTREELETELAALLAAREQVP
jgi:hypothetical protein